MYTIPVVDLVHNRRKDGNATTSSSIEVRISYMRKQKYITTGIKVLPKQWRNGMIVQHPDSEVLNLTINKMVSTVRKIILDMVDAEQISLEDIPVRLSMYKAQRMSVVDYCRKKASVRVYGQCESTKKRYERFLRFLDGFCIKNFIDINDENVIKLDKYLIGKKMKASSRWNNYHRFLNTFILEAIKDGYISRNPYNYIRLDKGNQSEGLNKCLTPEELQKVETADLPTECLNKVRDLFIFQTYTCLSYIDMANFDISKIRDIKGKKAYIGKRHKTSRGFTIPMSPKAMQILEKYNGNLPIISNVKYNAYLKTVAVFAGINKPISSHWARHTGATLLLNNGVSMQVVSKICGHSSIKMTEQIYAKLLDETVVDAIL